jgi:zinc protease
VALLAAAIALATTIEGRTMTRTTTQKPGEIATSLLPSPQSPLVVFRVQFRVGAVEDPKGREGLNALTAAMIGEGGTQSLTFREVTDRLYPMAAAIAAQPDREVTTFVGSVHRDHLAAFYSIFSDVLLRPRFDPADFSRIKDQMLAALETNLRGNDDENLGKAALEGLMYQGHPYGHLDLGTVQGLKAITLDDVKGHYRKHYTRDRLVIGVAGGYPKGLIDTVKQDFAALTASGPQRGPLPAPRALEGKNVLIVDRPAPATAISIGAPIAVTRSDKDFYALMVANSWLGEHRTFNGRLMNKMRGERGLNYGDYSYIENFIQEGGGNFPLTNIPRRQQHFSIWIRPVAPANALFAVRQALRELQILIDKGMTREDFEATRKYLLNYSRLWTQDLGRRLGCQIDSQYYGTAYFIDRVQQELPKLKVEDVNAAVKKHLNARNLAIAIVTDDAAGVRDRLLSGAPTPITYQTPTTSEALLKEDKEIEAWPLPVDTARVRIVPAAEMFER